MAGLAGLVPVTGKIVSPHGDFEVQGLSLEGLAGLLTDYAEDMKSLFEGDLDFHKLLVESPDLAAKIIALAAGEPEYEDNVKALPFGVQIIALKKIWDLTAVDIEELGKLLRSLTAGMESLDLAAISQSASTNTSKG